MFYRLSCVAVVVFWIVMTIMLVVRSFFWGEDRLPLVGDPESVIERFIANPESSNLSVYRGGEKVGYINVSPRTRKSGNVVIRLDASGEMDFPGLEKQEVAWRGKLELDSKREVVSFEITAKFDRPRLDIGLMFDPLTYELNYKVKEEGDVLIDSENRNSKAVKRVKFMLAALGLSPKALKKKDQRGDSLSEGKVLARFGKVIIAGERQVAYILYLNPKKRSKAIKLYFSETGELLKVGKVADRPGADDSVMGYTVLSQGFGWMADDGEKAQ